MIKDVYFYTHIYNILFIFIKKSYSIALMHTSSNHLITLSLNYELSFIRYTNPK